ncbi:hypothetical protein IW262DRAFT_1297370 [Armillaria fumosa]|nr:hypothetical protein IW262DRAFT_1297370 [Armillaria fumosa]
MPPSIKDELPLITARISFQPILSDEILPTITPRMCFSHAMAIYHPAPDTIMPDSSTPGLAIPESRVLPSRQSRQQTPDPHVVSFDASPVVASHSAAPAESMQGSNTVTTPLGQSSPASLSGRTQKTAPTQPNNATQDLKYTKPTGEPGQPSNGGYNLEKKLLEQCGWSKEVYKDVRGDVRQWASAKLDFSLCYKSQKTDDVSKVLRKAIKKYPWLEPYNDCWPVVAMLKGILKNGSHTYRQAKKARYRKQRRRASVSSSSSDSE